MRNRRYLVLCCILISLLLSYADCRREFCNPPANLDTEEIAPVSKKIRIDVFFDASRSMKGFVEAAHSIYARTIQILERASIIAWPKDSIISYNKFGTIIQQIERKDFFSEAMQPSFYIDRKFQGKTCIEKVLNKAKTENLTIIITDLFQNNSDVNLLISKFNTKFLKEDIAFGVLGIKSEFVGKVFDVGIQELSFRYSTENRKAKDFRPFYVLMLGKYNDIKHYYENLVINGLDSFPEKYFIIFSSSLVEKLASFEDSVLTETSKIKEVTNLLAPGTDIFHVKQFLVSENCEKASFQVMIKPAFLPFTIDFNKQRLKTVHYALRYQVDRFEACIPSLKGLKIDNDNLVFTDSRLNFTTDLFPMNLPGNGTYCFQVIIQPLQDAYSLPKWISEWDMDQNLINKWRNNPEDFKGNTTLNLKIFLNNVWQIIYQKNQPKIANLYFYIRKR